MIAPHLHVLMSSMKDEGPFVLEFVAHHLVLGFDRIMIASNDCSDGTDGLLAALQDAGYIQHVNHSVAQGEVPQHAGYAKLRAQFGLDGIEWLMVLDADEFLHVSVGDGRVQDLTAVAPPDVDIIALNAKTFGTQAGMAWQPGLVCAQFTRRLPLRHSLNGAIKSLTRQPHRFRAIHNHAPWGFPGARRPVVMRAGGALHSLLPKVPMWKQLRIAKIKDISHEFAHYNHYAIKTYDSFALRAARGRGAIPLGTLDKARHTDDYFAAHAAANVVDLRIWVYATAVQQKMQQMLADPAIATAQARCDALYAALLAPYRR